MTPIASVIIPHHNDRTRLLRCLAAIKRCCMSKDVEVIVVDNGIPTLDTHFIQSHPTVRFYHEPRKGAAHARNMGVDNAKGYVLIFTDSDCQVAPDFLKNAITAGRKFSISGGSVLLTSGPSHFPNHIQSFEHVFAFNQRRYIEEMNFSVTANLVTNISVFRNVGPFRPGLSEDKDWGERATGLGHKIHFYPDMIVYHPSRSTWNALSTKWRRITAEAHSLHQTNDGSTLAWIGKALLLPISIIIHVPKICSSPELSTHQQRLGAISVLARLRLWRMKEMIRLALPLLKTRSQ